VISTPDHWHVPISIAAAKAGKDIECEKPTLTVEEGRRLVDTMKRYGRVFQWSTEDRAVDVQLLLADTGHHRGPSVPDLLVAATAEKAGLTVLAVDKDFDLIASITGQPVEPCRRRPRDRQHARRGTHQ
jgi:predicted nucleic acid-binding protein